MRTVKNDKNSIIGGVVWKFLERITAQLITFIVSIVLARLLSPEEYGAVTVLLIFINIANVFVTNGVCDALIQKKDATHVDFSSMFWVALCLSMVLYFILYISAPSISEIYKTQSLVPLLRVLSLRIPLSAISNIQHAYVSKHMQFKKFFYSTLIGTVISGVVGIGLAYRGLGPWALVFQYLTNTTIDAIVLLFTIEWKPKFEFSLKLVTQMIPFSVSMTFAALANTLYGELQAIVIGLKYTVADLSYYKKGFSFPQLVIINIDAAISSALFPVISECNDDINQVVAIQRKAIKMSTFLIFPLMFGMAAISQDLIRILLTEKWIGASFYLVLGCFFYSFQPIQTTTWQALKALGKGALCIKCEFLKKIFGVLFLVCTIPFGVKWVAFGIVLSGTVSCIINMIAYSKVTNYSVISQTIDILPNLVISIVMLISIMPIGSIMNMGSIGRLIVQVLVGIAVYLVVSIIFKNESLVAICEIGKRKIGLMREGRR